MTSGAPAYTISRLSSGDVERMTRMTRMFGKVFEDVDMYEGRPPSREYLEGLLEDPTFIALAAECGPDVVGGLVAYVFRKFEQEAGELYIYDLAVVEAYRRRGIATALIEKAGRLARDAGVYVMFIQADGDNDAAVALYSSLGTHERIHHFEIDVPGRPEGQGS